MDETVELTSILHLLSTLEELDSGVTSYAILLR